jgi:hypothetical protein
MFHDAQYIWPRQESLIKHNCGPASDFEVGLVTNPSCIHPLSLIVSQHRESTADGFVAFVWLEPWLCMSQNRLLLMELFPATLGKTNASANGSK